MGINKNSITRALHGVKYKIKDASPEILVVAGVVGGITSAVMACKATRKIDLVLNESKIIIDKIKEVEADPEIAEIEYTHEDAKKDLAITYTRAGIELLKLYGPSLIVGGLSVTAIFASSNIMRKRNLALAAAYATVDKGFKEYKGRVIERFGEEIERELACNTKALTFEEQITDDKGKTKTVKKEVQVSDGTLDPYAVFYQEGCREFSEDSARNKQYVAMLQNELNDKLQRVGRMRLNDVYAAIGVPEIPDGNILGWIYDPKIDTWADSMIDFGIFDIYKEANRDFVNGYEAVILLEMRNIKNMNKIWKSRERRKLNAA